MYATPAYFIGSIVILYTCTAYHCHYLCIRIKLGMYVLTVSLFAKCVLIDQAMVGQKIRDKMSK